MFQKPGRAEKSIKTLDSTDSGQHIRRQMEELKNKLDSLDRGERQDIKDSALTDIHELTPH